MSSFVRDPTASLASEFSRLAISQGLSRGSDAYRNQRRRFYADAVTADFETHFGRNEASLEAWRDLLKTCGIRDEDIPSSITGCKKILKGIFVNIVDLVEARNKGRIVKTFQSAGALRKYIHRTGKIFPKEQAKRNPLLRAFLIVVF